MEYHFSTIVDPATYSTQGLCNGIPLRIHKNADLEDIGALRAQEDWRKHVGAVDNYKGGLGPMFSFIAVTVPECRPERLEILAYANEFAFITDNESKEIIDMENNDMLDVFRKVATSRTLDPTMTGKRRIQAQMMLEMFSLDEECAMTTLKSWATFLQNAAGREHHKHFKSLDEYLPYRCQDAGEMFWYGLVTFGMGLKIPKEEMPLCEKLVRSGFIAISLTNDLFSWEKEFAAAVEHGQKDVVNAIWVIMEEHSCSIVEAKEICRRQIKQNITKYVRVVKKARTNTSISLDLRKYLEALLYSISGNLVWSLSCPRYHTNATYNHLQLLRMKHGLAKYPALTVFARL